MEADLKLVPAKCGCEGCYYEDADECPGDDKPKLSACSNLAEGKAMIFIKEHKDESGV